METDEKKLTAEEGILIIQQMIANTKVLISDNSYYFLMWGWLTVISSLGCYILLKTPVGTYSYFIWFLLPLAGIPLSIYHTRKKPETAKTYIGLFIQKIWTSMGITSMIIFGLIFFVDFPIILIFLLLLGTVVYITGAVMKFKPLIVGAVSFWLCAIICAFLKGSSIQFLIYAISIFVGYIIPGYILKSQYKKHNV